MKNNVKVILFYVLLIAAIFVAVLAMMGNPSSNEEPIFSDIMQYFEEDRVKEFEVSSENVLTLIVYKTDKAGLLMPEDVANAKTEKINYKLRDIELFRAEFEKYQNNKNLEKYDYKPLASYVWMSLIPTILTIVAGFFLVMYMMKQMNKREGGMMSFGKAKAHMPDNDKNKVTFADVAGAEEEKEELVEIVEFLKDPQHLPFCKATEKCERTSTFRISLYEAPPIIISPSLGSKSPASNLIRVLFPLPVPPIKAICSPCFTVSERFSRTFLVESGYVKERLLISISKPFGTSPSPSGIVSSSGLE